MPALPQIAGTVLITIPTNPEIPDKKCCVAPSPSSARIKKKGGRKAAREASPQDSVGDGLIADPGTGHLERFHFLSIA